MPSKPNANQSTPRPLSGLDAEKDAGADAAGQTITADKGTEFHNYRELESILGAEVYFTTSHHAWERGTNENTNGLIRPHPPRARTWADPAELFLLGRDQGRGEHEVQGEVFMLMVFMGYVIFISD